MERFKLVVPALANFFNFSTREISKGDTQKKREAELSKKNEELKSMPAVAVALDNT